VVARWMQGQLASLMDSFGEEQDRGTGELRDVVDVFADWAVEGGSTVMGWVAWRNEMRKKNNGSLLQVKKKWKEEER